MVQWLGLCTFPAESPGWGTRVPQTVWTKQQQRQQQQTKTEKKKSQNQRENFNSVRLMLDLSATTSGARSQWSSASQVLKKITSDL